jgi:PAS domain S-box-containing protein
LEDRDLLERFEKLLEAGKNDWHEIYRVRAENGDIKWIEGFGNIQRAADGTPLRVIGTVVDITQRKEIEEALVESTHQLDLILNSLTDVVWAVSLPDRKPMYCSESFRELFGREVYEWIEDNTIWEEIVHPEDRHIIPRVYAEVRTEGASDLEYRLLRSDGSVVWISSRLKVVPGSGKDPSILLGIVRDISERKRFEESLIRATEAAEEANRAKTEFLSRMSHELRTPMNAILGFGQLLELDADKLTPDQRDSIRHIIEGGEHLLSLINEVLDISRVDAGMMELSVEPVLLEDALQSAITLIGPLANHKGVTIKTEPAHSGCHLLADRQRLIQVLVNLMSNAVKYNNENGEVIISCVTSAANGENGTMRVQVQDTGHGIRQQDFKKIFEPFQRVHVRGAPVEGTGIGLAITRKLVELMDGRIGFESEYGVGTTFWFELPLTAADAAGGDQEMSDREILDLDAEITVLYVEDNAANRKLVSQALGGLSRCNLLSADNAEDGIAIAREKLPDLILMDLGLPGMDGFEALKVLRADNLTSEIPVIAVTAHAMPEFRKKGREAGFDDYLVKPIKINQLFSTFQKHRLT